MGAALVLSESRHLCLPKINIQDFEPGNKSILEALCMILWSDIPEITPKTRQKATIHELQNQEGSCIKMGYTQRPTVETNDVNQNQT